MTTRGRLLPVVGTALVVLLVAAVAAIAWFTFSSEPRPIDVPAAASPDRSRPPPAPAAPPAPAISATRVATPEDVDRELRRNLDKLRVPADQLPIMVVALRDELHPRSLEGRVELDWTTEKALAHERESRRATSAAAEDLDAFDLVREIGTRVEQRESGFSIPRSAGPVVITAKSDELSALVRATGNELNVLIELAAADSIAVQIVDAKGKPQPDLIATFGPRGQEPGDTTRRARTKGAGAIATIRGVHALVRSMAERTDVEWGVSALVPSRETLFIPVDVKALPERPVVVRLPPSGSLLVTFIGRDGRRVMRPIKVRLIARSRGDGKTPPDVAGDLFERHFVVKEGALELPVCGLGLRFDVKSDLDHAKSANELVNGPAAAGESVERAVAVDFGPVVFHGSLIDDQAVPLAHRRLTIRVIASRGSSAFAFETPCIGEGETAETGEFEIEVPLVGHEASLDCEVVVHSVTGLDRTLKAVAGTVRQGDVRELGRLHLPGK